MSITLNGTTGIIADSPATVKANAFLDASGGNTATINGKLPIAIGDVPAPTSAQVGTATAGLSATAIGSYAWLAKFPASTDAITFGTTYAGSGLAASGFTTPGTIAGNALSSILVGAAVSGTWRAMGTSDYAAVSNIKQTLFLRIS